MTLVVSKYAPRVEDYQRPNPRSKGSVQDHSARVQVWEILRKIRSTLKVTLIVCNDEASLRAITGETLTLDQANGSLYWLDQTPVLCVADIRRLFMGGWIGFEMQEYFKKIARWANGTQKKVPEFRYKLCTSLSDVEGCVKAALKSVAMANDIETIGTLVSCIGYTCLNTDGSCDTFVVPFIDQRHPESGYCYWQLDEEVQIRKWLAELNACETVKVYQNGPYDIAYELRDGMPPTNYLLDTMGMAHSLFCEGEKKLNILAAFNCDYYSYWKDDSKGVKDLATGDTTEKLESYWRYNGLDTYWTLLVALAQLETFKERPYAYANYSTTFHLAVGPCISATFRGFPISTQRHAKIISENSKEADEACESIQRLVGWDQFNPASSQQVGSVLYDFFGAKQTRLQQRKPKKYGKHSTDKAVLKLIREQRNIFANDFINRVERFKKSQDVISDYGKLWKYTYKHSGRVIEWMNPWGTETARMSSTHSQFWCGSNGQNIAPELREWYVAPQDWVIVDADYRASDDWWVAYESMDPAKIAMLLEGKDPHSWHAAIFYGIPYEKILAGKKAHEPWVVRKPDGVREVAKHIGHGKNYMAQPETIYDQMGRDATVAAAITMGYQDASGWQDKQLIAFIGMLCDKYDHPQTGLYRRLRPWQKEFAQRVVGTSGRFTNVFGYTRQFLTDPSKDTKAQRELCAQAGQGDTAGNINKALLSIFYGGIDNSSNCMFIKQGHDSLTFLVHRSVLSERINQIKTIMERPVELNGHSVSVPVDCEVGLTWGKTMLPWSPSVTYEQIQEFERVSFSKKYPPNSLPIQQEPPEADILDLSRFTSFADTLELSAEEIAELSLHQDAELDELELEGVTDDCSR